MMRTYALAVRCAPLVLLLACDHSRPFADDPPQTDWPATPGLPRRLTYAAPGELAPSWAPGGGTILYTLTRVDGGQVIDGLDSGDRCVAFLPAEGGQVRRQLCLTPPYSERTLDVQQEAALGPHGTLAFVRSSDPDRNVLVVPSEIVATDTLGRGDRSLLALPARASNGVWYHGASRLRWLDASRLLFVAERLGCTNRCADTVRTGIGVVQLTIGPAGATAELLAGTERATSFAAGESGELYLTRVNDPRVYRREPGGAVSVAWDFGAGVVARDVDYHGGHLAVVAGGLRLVDDPFDDPDMGVGHIDGGGELHVIDLAENTAERHLFGFLLTRRPAISPDGRRIVLEVLGETGGPALWLLETPWAR
jgi:hypothetical protein